MKVAIIHDYIKEYGGAERVLEALHEIWPEATVFTTVYLPRFLGPHAERFKPWKIVTSWVQNVPYVEKMISPMRLITPWIFENWDFRGYDLVIVSATGAYVPNLIVRKPETVHICYCHTPPRFLYGYPTARNWQKSAIGRVVAAIFNHWFRQVDFMSYQRPDHIISNSHEVRRRIEKFYRRDASVIYPPVEMAHTRYKIQDTRYKNKKYFITGGRLARAKHIDLAIEACNRLKIPLKIFGRGFAGYEEELRKIAGPTIEFVGEVEDEALPDLYANAKALLYPSEHEDFGIMPVEAQACGIPVVAYRQGGVIETVIDGKTGVFFDELTAESMVKAMKKLNIQAMKPEDCRENAKLFSKERFKREIKTYISKVMNHNS